MTNHKIICGDSKQLNSIQSNSVQLIVTSPPYPMIEMWDQIIIFYYSSVFSLPVCLCSKLYSFFFQNIYLVF